MLLTTTRTAEHCEIWRYSYAMSVSVLHLPPYLLRAPDYLPFYAKTLLCSRQHSRSHHQKTVIISNMPTKLLRTCAGCNEALGRSEFSKNQWMKGSGTSRCKGCVSGPASANTTIKPAAEKSAAPEIKPVAAVAPSSSEAKKSSKALVKAPSSSNKTGSDENKKSKSKASSEVSDEMAALATITSAVSKDEVAAASANQKPGEASTEDSSKNIKVKNSDLQGKKKKGNPIGWFFGGIVRGVGSWTRPVLNPCMKMIGQQVVVTEEGGNEDLKMKEQLEDDAQKYSLKGRNE